MVTATVTTKGQITIPKAVRESLRLRSGDRVAFVMHGHSEALMKPITESVDEVFGRLHNPAQPPRTVAQMKAAVAARLRSRTRW
jgi:antitoxin PrlF